jgi:hypothetical protein
MNIFNVLKINNVPFENLVNKDVDVQMDETLDEYSENGLENKEIYNLIKRLYLLIEKTGYIDEHLDDIFYNTHVITYISNEKIKLNNIEINQDRLSNYISDSNRLIIKNERTTNVNIDYILNLEHLKYCECISNNLNFTNSSLTILPNLKTLIIPNSNITNITSINCSSYLKFCCVVDTKDNLTKIDSTFNNITFSKREPIKYYGLSNDNDTEILLNDLEYENMYINLKNFKFYDNSGNTKIKNVILSNSGNITNLHGFTCCFNLSSIIIPTTVKSLSVSCFVKCTNLSSIDLPTSVETLNNYCFTYCTNLSSINLPTSVKTLGYESFSYCFNLTSIIIPTSLKKLGTYCFRECSNLLSIDIPTSITELNTCCFSGCSNLSSINIPTSVLTIGGSCFENVKSDIHFNILTSEIDKANSLGWKIKNTSNTPSGAKYYYHENNNTWTLFTPSQS